MLNDERASTSHRDDDIQVEDDHIRDIHALTPPHPNRTWETTSHRSSSISMSSEGENFTSISREFNALVIAGAEIGNHGNDQQHPNNLGRIREEDMPEEETNPLAIVRDNHPFDQSVPVSVSVPVPLPSRRESSTGGGPRNDQTEISLQMVKKEEVESKISAWQNAKIAKINNRFKREDAVIIGWETEQVNKATSWMKRVERKLEEKRARALEKMQNEVAKAHRKAEERRASAESKRGTKVAKVFEISNLMRAVGRPPAKRSFF